jgi:hypothetical protein
MAGAGASKVPGLCHFGLGKHLTMHRILKGSHGITPEMAVRLILN